MPRLSAVMRTSGIEPQLLKLELTQSLVLEEFEALLGQTMAQP